MRLFLANAVHAVDVGGDLVFLDVEADAYFCLAGAGAVIALGPGGEVDIRRDEAASQLLEAGLLARDPGEDCRRLPPRPLVSARSCGARARTGLPAWFAAIAVSLEVRRRFSRCSFANLLETAQDGRALDVEPAPELLETAAQFERMRPWLPLKGECLLRSYHLRAFLRSQGFDATWVFGVRTWPFSAHCWLQVGRTVLDEDLERLAAYAPIMAV